MNPGVTTNPVASIVRRISIRLGSTSPTNALLSLDEQVPAVAADSRSVDDRSAFDQEVDRFTQGDKRLKVTVDRGAASRKRQPGTQRDGVETEFREPKGFHGHQVASRGVTILFNDRTGKIYDMTPKRRRYTQYFTTNDEEPS